MATNPRQVAHELIEQMAESQVAAMVGLLEAMLDPASRAIASAPFDEEELTAETMAALGRANESLDRGERVSHEEILREFGG